MGRSFSFARALAPLLVAGAATSIACGGARTSESGGTDGAEASAAAPGASGGSTTTGSGANANANASAAGDASADTPLPSVAPKDAGSGSASPAEGGVAPSACTKLLSVTITQSGVATCVYNTQVVATSPATLDYACSGGAASATFGAQTFVGTLKDGNLTITNESKYPFTVHNVQCWYTAKQVISGTLASGTLQYTYTEALDPGQSTACLLATAACDESGVVTVK